MTCIAIGMRLYVRGIINQFYLTYSESQFRETNAAELPKSRITVNIKISCPNQEVFFGCPLEESNSRFLQVANLSLFQEVEAEAW